MNFQCCAKYGNRWSYKGTIEAKDSRQAALRMQYIYGRNVWKVRPDYSNGGFFFYRFTAAPQVTS